MIFVAIITTIFFANPSQAAPGVNQTISFQARLLLKSGGVVPDGDYNIEFRIYQDGNGQVAGNTAGAPAGTLKWSESYVNGGSGGIRVKNGQLSVNLGSVTPFGNSVDWNQDTLWLSMNIAGTAANCTTFGTGSCVADGEMLPMKRITSVPFALNAGRLGGLTAADFLQNTGLLQTGSLLLSGTIQSNTSVQAPNIDTPTATALGIGTTNATSVTIGKSGTTTTIQGELETNSLDTTSATDLDIGTTNATNINLNQNVTVAEGKSLTIAGGATSTRPANPSEGTLYYDTTTKELLVYDGSKWQSNRSSKAKIVASSTSSQNIKDGADYVATGTNDQVVINSALTAAAGGKVYLMEGTYTLGGSVVIPNNTTLSGAGAGTVLTIANGLNADINAITNATSGGNGTGIAIQDLRLEGNKANQTSGNMRGIFLNGVSSSSSSLPGAVLTNLRVNSWRTHGIDLTSSANSSVVSSSISSNGTYGINLTSSSSITLTANNTQNNLSGIFIGGSTGNTITGNTSQGDQNGINTNSSSELSIIGNTMRSNSRGIFLNSASSRNTVTGNSIQDSLVSGINLLGGSDSNIISSNTILNSGSSSANNGLVVDSSNKNNIGSNTITDTIATTTNYGIVIADSSSTANRLTNNSIDTSTINDLGTNTIYGGQTTTSDNYVIQPAGTIELMGPTNVTGNLTVSSLQTNSIDTKTGGALSIGTVNASSITLAQNTTVANGKSLAINGNTSITTTSSAALLIQNASSTPLFTADTSLQQIVIGTTANGIILSANGIQLHGTARNTKSIILTPEYAGAVLDAQNDATCVANSNGTMTASYDIVNRANYYNWTSTQSTNQCYDVVVQVPIPSDFSGWQSSSIMMRTSNPSNAAYAISIMDSSGAYDANYGSSYSSPGSLGSSWSNVATSSLNGIYTPGDYFTVRVRMSAKNDANVQLGAISLYYYSNR